MKRDIEARELLREFIEDTQVVVETDTVRVTYGELRKLVREALAEAQGEDQESVSEEMDAPEDLVTGKKPLNGEEEEEGY